MKKLLRLVFTFSLFICFSISYAGDYPDVLVLNEVENKVEIISADEDGNYNNMTSNFNHETMCIICLHHPRATSCNVHDQGCE